MIETEKNNNEIEFSKIVSKLWLLGKKNSVSLIPYSEYCSKKGIYPLEAKTVSRYMLWFNFILGSIFIFLCFFFCMVMYNNEYKTKEKKLNQGKPQRTRPYHVQVESSSCCFPRELDCSKT